MKRFTKLAAATAVAALTSAGAMAASDGTLGTTSTGTTEVSISKGTLVQVTGMQDLAYAPANSFAAIPAAGVLSVNVCVFSSTAGYTMVATGSEAPQAAGEFNMYNGGIALDATDYINYTLDFTDNTTLAPQTVSLVRGAATINLSSGTSTLGCAGDAGSVNSTITSTIDGVEFDAAVNNAIYSETVTMIFTAI